MTTLLSSFPVTADVKVKGVSGREWCERVTIEEDDTGDDSVLDTLQLVAKSQAPEQVTVQSVDIFE
jgi:hypothetical protein